MGASTFSARTATPGGRWRQCAGYCRSAWKYFQNTTQRRSGHGGWEQGGGGAQGDTCSGLLQAPSSLTSASAGRKHLALRTWLLPHCPATGTLASSCHHGATSILPPSAGVAGCVRKCVFPGQFQPLLLWPVNMAGSRRGTKFSTLDRGGQPLPRNRGETPPVKHPGAHGGLYSVGTLGGNPGQSSLASWIL